MAAKKKGTPRRSPKWAEFERLAAAVQLKLEPDAFVTWDVTNFNRTRRQIDVHVRHLDADSDLIVLIECRRLKRRLRRTAVEAWATKARLAGANKAVIVTTSGYDEAALIAADQCDIDTYVLKRADDEDWNGYLRGVSMVFTSIVPRYTNIVLHMADGRDLSADPLCFARNAGGTRCLDRFLSYIVTQSKPGPRQEHFAATFTEPVFLIGDDGESLIEGVDFRRELVNGLSVAAEHTRPEDWVFYRLGPNRHVDDKSFYEFSQISALAKQFKKGVAVTGKR